MKNCLGNNEAVKSWLARQREDAPSSHPAPATTPRSPDTITAPIASLPDPANDLQRARLATARQAVRTAMHFDERDGPTLDHLRLTAIILADAVYFFCDPSVAALPDHGTINRSIEKPPDQLSLLTLLGAHANAAVLADLSFDGTDLVCNGRSRWAKSHFNLLPAVQQALALSEQPDTRPVDTYPQ